MNLIQLLTDQWAYEGTTHSRWGASWNWRWRRVGDDEEQRSPSPEPQTDSRSGSRWRTGGDGGSVSWITIILSPWFFSGKTGLIASVSGFEGPQGGDNPPGRARRGACPCGLCPPRCPPPVDLGSRNSYLLHKNPRKVSFHSENFYLCTIKHHGSFAENNVSPGLVSFKSCKLESKTRGKVLGKVDTLETYQLPQA